MHKQYQYLVNANLCQDCKIYLSRMTPLHGPNVTFASAHSSVLSCRGQSSLEIEEEKCSFRLFASGNGHDAFGGL
jgi:hypothetical protein